MELSSSSAIFGHSSAQLLRPKLGFMDLLPRQAMIVSSSSLPRFLRMESQSQLRQSISCASSPSENVFQARNSSSSIALGRIGEVKRQLASHGLFDVHVRATGDVHIDDHHTNEDIALAIGTASVADILFPV